MTALVRTNFVGGRVKCWEAKAQGEGLRGPREALPAKVYVRCQSCGVVLEGPELETHDCLGRAA